MEHKRLAVALKDDAEGAFRAIFATFNEVDHDGDVTLAGAFPVGAKLPLAGVGHNWDTPTIGGGTIGADQEKAWLDGQFNLEMAAGLETYRSVKFDQAQGINAQQYSYAYDVAKGHSARPEEQKRWPGAKRILEQLVPHEVSPVLLGAGIDTGTAYIKGKDGDPETLATRALRLLTDTSAFAEHARAAVAMRAKEGRELSTVNRERIGQQVAALKAAAAELAALLPTPAAVKATEDPAVLRSLHRAKCARLAREFAIPQLQA